MQLGRSGCYDSWSRNVCLMWPRDPCLSLVTVTLIALRPLVTRVNWKSKGNEHVYEDWENGNPNKYGMPHTMKYAYL